MPVSTSSSGVITGDWVSFNVANSTPVTTAGTGTSIFHSCDFQGGSASAISIGAGTTVQILDSCSVTSSNTNAITGSGTLQSGLIIFNGTSSTVNTTTQTYFQIYPSTTRTFTPTIIGSSVAGTATYVTQVGLYSRIGNIVTIQINLSWNSGNGSGNLQIAGLPFTANASNANATWPFRLDSASLPASTVNAVAQVTVNSTTISFVGSTIGGSASAVAYAAAASVYVSGTYLL
jgi:hypothetical protein